MCGFYASAELIDIWSKMFELKIRLFRESVLLAGT